MGHQGGIARFTGSLGGMNFYFDDDRESVRWKSQMNRKKWLARKEMWRQHNSSRLFGAASIIAGNLWQGMPAGLRRLADGSGYGRLVGRCASLMGDDGQLWDADLLKGLELNEDALAPYVRFGVRKAGGFRIEGLDQLNRELDLALGDKAGTVPATFLVAHGLGPFGLGMKGLQLSAEEAQVKTAFRVGGARDQGLGARNRVSEEGGFRWPEASGRIGVRPEAAASNTTTASRPQKQVQRRYRVWVNAVKVAETLWISAQEKFHLDTSHGVGGVGYVTDWEQDFPDSLDLRNPFEGETMEFDGEYVVYCALEVSEKRGRHWVRLPYCCKFRLVDLVAIENRQLVPDSYLVDHGAFAGEEGLGSAERESPMIERIERLDFVDADGLVFIEFKRPCGACLETLKGFVQWLDPDLEPHRISLLGSGMRAGP